MRKPLTPVGFGLGLLVAAGPATRPTPATGPTHSAASRAADVAGLVVADPPADRYAGVFAPSFLAAVPPAKLTALFRDTFAAAGRCTGVVAEGKPTATEGTFRLTFARGVALRLTVSTDGDRVAGMWLGPLAPAVDSFDALIGRLQSLPGTTSLYAARLDGNAVVPVAAYNDGQPLAIGSAFKLYVLAAVVADVADVGAGRRHWDDVVHLDPAARSLPGGAMRDWPAGSPVTLHTLATLMISQSDNTATDQLIRVVGRAAVEAQLRPAGMADPARDEPFLTTAEMFKVKGDPAGKLADAYAAADAAGRRALLAGPVAAMPVDAVRYPSHPSHLSTVEWLATTADLCRAMRYLRDVTETPDDRRLARDVLAVNPGLPLDKAVWPYAGYKGGSELGVLNLTFLLRDAAGRWFTLSMTWNDPNAAVDEAKFIGLAEAATKLLQRPG